MNSWLLVSKKEEQLGILWMVGEWGKLNCPATATGDKLHFLEDSAT
jgi:hypothetical protein